ncbi:uncharacterized protein LOC117182521 [Belonocnema kinseyi]|uniref:uncharacterized protein LOC117182521 n=1 Tax=Belonocnema kinseyi TaxID=2817044 RepID=UPI00143D0571|nr:uncharacterized protein LOC117182521 [Belonocnema kinseyi]
MVAGIIPIDLLAIERKEIYERKREENIDCLRKLVRDKSVSIFQERIQISGVGKWTARLIPNIQDWINRSHGEVNFYLTQFLKGHAHFNKYLYRRNKKNSPNCDYCPEKEDDVEHTFFECERWREIRTTLERKIADRLSLDSITRRMTEGEHKWDAVATFVETVLRSKKKEEREREGG